MEIVRITDTEGRILDDALLARAESVHRQLRAQIPQPYAARMKEIFATGAEMVVAVEGGEVCGVRYFGSPSTPWSARRSIARILWPTPIPR